MPFNTFSVACATTPTVISTFFSHFFNSAPHIGTPFSQISYHEGIALTRRFLVYASHHTVEQLQAFTAQYVPHPTWVHTEDAMIPDDCISLAATHLIEALGPESLKKVGGQKWWQWRTRPLSAEWVEMRSDYNNRRAKKKMPGGERPKTILYLHGGAYYFGSVDLHRYQLQRHARKLQGRVFAPRYRLAPQFPFPCAVHDALSSYLYLLQNQDASTIVFAGDSAGAGLVVSLLVILRDQGLPMPAGAVLISAWVDLCHSFPSVVADNSMDFIPPHGFLHRPSIAWPPPTRQEIVALESSIQPPPPTTSTTSTTSTSPAADTGTNKSTTQVHTTSNHGKEASTVVTTDTLAITIDGNTIPLHNQLQMYTTNDLLAHPLVSPVNQASLGGLCPLLFLVGGGEVLRDEQIYLAHKAAMPHRFLANPVHAESKSKEEREKDDNAVKKWGPTKVMLQVYDDCCHVTPALSFTHPAKLMYRSIAHFCAWALATANKDQSISAAQEDASLSSGSSSSDLSNSAAASSGPHATASSGDVDYTTTPRGHMHSSSSDLPPFDPVTNMIRQRISYSGDIYDLPPIPPDSIISQSGDPHPHPTITATPSPHAYTSPLLHPTTSIGVLTAEPIRRWLEMKKTWDTKYERDHRSAKAKRTRIHTQLLLPQLNNARHQDADRSQVVEKENPPPGALYGRTLHAFEEEKEKKREERRKKTGKEEGFGLGLWGWSKCAWGHDQSTIVKEIKKEKRARQHEKKEEKKEAKKNENGNGSGNENENGNGNGNGNGNENENEGRDERESKTPI